MALDSCYSVKVGKLRTEGLRDILAVLEGIGFRLWDDALDARTAEGERSVIQSVTEFREHLGGELSVTLLEDLGGLRFTKWTKRWWRSPLTG